MYHLLEQQLWLLGPTNWMLSRVEGEMIRALRRRWKIRINPKLINCLKPQVRTIKRLEIEFIETHDQESWIEALQGWSNLDRLEGSAEEWGHLLQSAARYKTTTTSRDVNVNRKREYDIANPFNLQARDEKDEKDKDALTNYGRSACRYTCPSTWSVLVVS